MGCFCLFLLDGCLSQGAPKEGNNTMNLTRNLKSVALALAGVILIPSCATTGNASSKPQGSPNEPALAVKSVEHGKASWYSIKTNRGTKTASGQRLCNHGSTAAHKTLPMGTKVRVVNMANGKSELVTINDRGPFIKGRIIDVTIGTAERLGFAKRGVVPVRVEVLGKVKVDGE
jgi:rare lipoprotein A